jgi:outer membrane protein OmpA-like peptidoglycan-associated protein
MWKFTQFADQFDEVSEKADQLVLKGADEDVDRWWGVRVAHAANYAGNRLETFLFGGYVDLLRLGDGIKEGGWRGWAQDGLRLLQILPIGRVSKFVGRSLRRANRIRRAVAISERPGEKICAWVSMKQALIQTGVKHAATLDDVIEAARGIALRDSTGLFASEMAEILRNAGAKVTPLLGDAERMAFQDLEALVRRQKGGVVMVNLNFENVLRAPGEAAMTGHSLFAYLNDLGEFRMVDRSGMLRALSDIEQFYPGISKGTIKGAFHMADALVIRVLDELSGGPVWKIAFEIRSLFLGDKDDLDALFWQITQQLEENLPRPDEMPVRISSTDDSFTWIVGGGDPLKLDKLELTFDSNQSKFKPNQVMVLEKAWDKIRERLNPARQQTVVITGFSDNVGNDAYNRHISLKRAEAVAKWFLGRGHLTRDPRTGKGNLRTQGLGKEMPRASNGTAEGRAHNRRVDIVLLNRY